MAINELQKQTNINIQEKANLIWEIATQCWLNNTDSFKKLFNDPEFYQDVMQTMAKELYRTLRKE